MDNNIEASLLVGLPIKINDKFLFKAPIMKDILDIGFQNLMSSINTFYDINYAMYSNKDINDIIEQNSFFSYQTWQLIILLESKTPNKIVTQYFIDCLTWHISNDVEIVMDEEKNYIVKIDGETFNEEDYIVMCKILKIAYGLEEKIENRKFRDIAARRKSIEMRINRNEISVIENKDNSFLYQIISSLKIKKDMNELINSNLFQLMDLYKRINKEKEYDELMAGVYAGNVDTKKVDINKKHWTSSLK